MSQLVVFDLKELAEIDGGRVAAVFANHLKRAVSDIEDRPGDTKPREVNLKLKLVPDTGVDGCLDAVKMQVQCTSTIPQHRSKKYDFGVRNDGRLRFNKMSVTDHNAQSLPGMQDDYEDVEEDH